MKLLKFSAIAAIATLAACESYAGGHAAAPEQAQEATSAVPGSYLADTSGLSLYTFDKDNNGVSTCYDACAAAWPPLTAPAAGISNGAYSTISRDDGTAQWAYNGAPLYYYAGDAVEGDTNGDGAGGVWFLARP